jgi:hypothetical protein
MGLMRPPEFFRSGEDAAKALEATRQSFDFIYTTTVAVDLAKSVFQLAVAEATWLIGSA